MTDYDVETRFCDRWVHVVARPRSEGSHVIWDCIMTNVTERKETERQLEDEKNRLQMLGDNLPNSTLFQFVRDTRMRQMRLSYVSGTWETVTGIAADVAIADITKVFSTMPVEDFPIFLQAIEDSARTMTVFELEIRFGERWTKIVSRPRADNGNIIWDGIITDITERKDNETKLEEYRENLERLVQERTDELNVANEELCTANEELHTLNEQLNEKNIQLIEEIKENKKVKKKLVESETKISKALNDKRLG
jgi:PAS domain-containing protein